MRLTTRSDVCALVLLTSHFMHNTCLSAEIRFCMGSRCERVQNTRVVRCTRMKLFALFKVKIDRDSVSVVG